MPTTESLKNTRRLVGFFIWLLGLWNHCIPETVISA
jgi:uncharacterized membrane protein YiaA